jgi:hypothetical protein
VAQPAELNACKAFYSDELGEFLLRYQGAHTRREHRAFAPENPVQIARDRLTGHPP